MALHMARKLAGKPDKSLNEKVQLSLPPATLKRLRIAAAELGKDLSEVVSELIDTRFSGVHVRGMNPNNSAPSPTAGGSSGSQMPSGPSYATTTATNPPDDDEEEVTPANVMSTLPTPSPGSGFMKRSKVITDSYVRHSAPRDAAIDALASEN